MSSIGTWMESIAVGILVTQATGRASWAGIAAAAAYVPLALVSPFGGALADRVSRRGLLLGTTLVQTATAIALCVLSALDDTTPGIIVAIVFLASCAGAIGFPAYQAMIPDLVPRDELQSASALGLMQYNLGRVLGPVLAGVVIELGGFAWAFGVNAVSFLAVIAALVPLRLPTRTSPPDVSILGSIREGARFARREPGIRALMTYLALNSFLAAPFIALIPAVALNVFDEKAAGAAALVTAQGIGAVLMALALGDLTERLGFRRVLAAGLTALPVTLVLYGFAPTLPLAVVAIFAVGFVYLGCLSSFTSMTQLRAPPEMRGRMAAVFMVLIGSLFPLGGVIQGAIADEVGLRATTVGAAVLLAGALLAIRLVRPAFGRHLDEDPAVVNLESQRS